MTQIRGRRHVPLAAADVLNQVPAPYSDHGDESPNRSRDVMEPRSADERCSSCSASVQEASSSGRASKTPISRTLRPLTLRDGTGLTSLLPGAGRFRIYSVTGSLPSESAAEYRLEVSGTRATTDHADPARVESPAADPPHQGLPVRHRLAGRRRQVDRREVGRPARPRRREAGRHTLAVLLLRRCIHRVADDGPGSPRRRDRRVPR